MFEDELEVFGGGGEVGGGSGGVFKISLFVEVDGGLDGREEGVEGLGGLFILFF